MDTLWIVFAVTCAVVVYGVVILMLAQAFGVGLGSNDEDDQ